MIIVGPLQQAAGRKNWQPPALAALIVGSFMICTRTSSGWHGRSMDPNSGSIVRRRRSSIRASPRRLESEYAMAEPARWRGRGEYLNPENTALRTPRKSTNKANSRLEVCFAVFTSTSHVTAIPRSVNSPDPVNPHWWATARRSDPEPTPYKRYRRIFCSKT